MKNQTQGAATKARKAIRAKQSRAVSSDIVILTREDILHDLNECIESLANSASVAEGISRADAFSVAARINEQVFVMLTNADSKKTAADFRRAANEPTLQRYERFARRGLKTSDDVSELRCHLANLVSAGKVRENPQLDSWREYCRALVIMEDLSDATVREVAIAASVNYSNDDAPGL